MVEIKNHVHMEEWLNSRAETRHADAMVLATRAALRVFPAMAELAHTSEEGRTTIILPVLRGIALPWAAGRYPALGRDPRFLSTATAATAAARDAAATAATHSSSALHSATRSAAESAAAAARSATRAATSRSAAAAAAAAARSAAAAAITTHTRSATRDAAAAVWEAISADAAMLEEGASAAQLAGEPLHLHEYPVFWDVLWMELRDALLAIREEDWGVWIDWYNARRHVKSPWSEQIEIARVLDITEEEWEQGPKVVNPRLREIMEGVGAVDDPPEIPPQAPGPHFEEKDRKLELRQQRSPDEHVPDSRTNIFLNELREAVRDFENSFGPQTNAHSALRRTASRYGAQLEIEDPSIDLLFALGLRLESAEFAANRDIANRMEPELEDSQQEALASLLRLHAVFIATNEDGKELLEAAERYGARPEDDEKFKRSAKPVVDGLANEPDLATEDAIDVVENAIEGMNTGRNPARAGVVGRNTLQNAFVFLASAAVGGLIGGVATATEAGQIVVQQGAPLADKAIHFLISNAPKIRELIAISPEGFSFIGRVIDWIMIRLGLQNRR